MTNETLPAKSHYETQQQPRTTVDEFIDNRDGTSTLTVTCADGKSVRFTMKTSKLKSLNVDKIYETIIKECGQ